VVVHKEININPAAAMIRDAQTAAQIKRDTDIQKTKQDFDKFMKSKCKDKVVGKTVQSQLPFLPGLLVKANLIKEIQELRSEEDAKIVLDFDIAETEQLTLLERAKLFVKLKYTSTNKEKKRVQKQSFKT